jgi:DNA-binding CsgD family transcriptional regulator
MPSPSSNTPSTGHAMPDPLSQDPTESLMQLAATLGELTHSPQQLAEIPVYLARAFEIERLTLGIVRDTPVGPEVVMSHSSGDFAAGNPRFAEEILTWYFRTRPVSESHGPVFRAEAATFPEGSVIVRDLGGGLRMLLVVHQAMDIRAMSEAAARMLPAVATMLAKFLSCAAAWMFHPETLAPPFSTLTPREWTVLRGLQTGAAEKELADQLNMSRHTLHSHVKAIYRKVGVPGRLLLMIRMQSVLRDMRIAKLENRQLTGRATS